MTELPENTAERRAFRTALEIIAGVRPALDDLMGNVDIARAALAQFPPQDKGQSQGPSIATPSEPGSAAAPPIHHTAE